MVPMVGVFIKAAVVSITFLRCDAALFHDQVLTIVLRKT